MIRLSGLSVPSRFKMRDLKTFLITTCLTAYLVACPSLVEPICAAQTNQDNAATAGGSFKDKMSAFQGKIKQQIRSLSGRETSAESMDAAAASPTDHFHFDRRRIDAQNRNPVAQANYEEYGSRQRQNQSASRGGNQQAQFQQPMQRNGRGRNGQFPVGPVVPLVDVNALTQQQMNLQRQAQANSRSTTSYTMPNPVQQNVQNQQSYSNDPALVPDNSQTAQFPHQQFENQLRHSQPNQSPYAPETMANSGYGEQASGHYQNGYSRVDTLADQRQLTASQRVLQLQADNQTLTEQRDAALTENKRLSDIIIENQKLLTRADASIESAMKQLESSNHNNQILKQRIAQLVAEKESVVAESKRMLDSIRKRLDDVLIREISSK